MSAVPTPLEIFRAQGIPHRRMEDWKYTDLRNGLDIRRFENPSALEFPARFKATFPGRIERSVVKANDFPIWAERLRKLSVDAGAMEAAAQAFRGNAAAYRVPAGEKLDDWLFLELRGEGHTEIVLLVERGARLTLSEGYDLTRAFVNVRFSIFLEEGSELTHLRFTDFVPELVSVETIFLTQERNSQYHAYFLNGGAKLSRTELNITLAGEGAKADLSGVSILGDGAHADITTRIVHAVPNTTSRQLFKKVAGGKSRAVYQGKITVKEGAIGSDSRQTAKALLLSNHAEADLKPELEILADDVKCAHGAAVGDLDADSLFYLRSRGIPEPEARGLLIEAFLQEVIDGIEDETVRASATDFVKEGLARAMADAS